MAFDTYPTGTIWRERHMPYGSQGRASRDEVETRGLTHKKREIHHVDFIKIDKAMVHYDDGTHELVRKDWAKCAELRALFATTDPQKK
jgi:hypothetical protein